MKGSLERESRETPMDQTTTTWSLRPTDPNRFGLFGTSRSGQDCVTLAAKSRIF